MDIVLPKTKIEAETQDPKYLILYGAPKIGKTTLLAELPNNLIIDLEKGSTYISALKIQVSNVSELSQLCKAIIEAGKPYDYITLDTITALEEMAKPLAAQLYKATPMGKNFTGGGEDILNLAQGAGQTWPFFG